MDPVSLSLGAVVAALVAKAVDRAEDGVVDAAGRVLSRLVGWLRERLPGGGGSQLGRVEDAPDSPSRLAGLAAQIDERVSEDPGFREQLQALVREAEQAGVDVVSVSQSAWGNQNVQIANASGADIRVTYGGQSSG